MKPSDDNRAYFEFYLMGRAEGEGGSGELDVDLTRLAREVIDGHGKTVRDIALATAKARCDGELTGSGKMLEWRKSSRKLRKAIDEAGGDNARAYRLYCEGYVDQVAYELEDEILNAVDDDEEEDEDEDEDDDEADPSGVLEDDD